MLRALDAGAQGVIAPHIDTVEQASARRFRALPTGRASRLRDVRAAWAASEAWSLLSTWMLRAETTVFGMIESPIGVANAADIASVSGLTASWSAPRTCGRPPRRRILTRSRQSARCMRCARPARKRTDGHRQRRRAGPGFFADGAQLVVYNLTATLMDHLRMLRGAR